MGIYSSATASKDKSVTNKVVMSNAAPKKETGSKSPAKKPFSPSPKK